MAHQKDGRKKPNFTIYKKGGRKASDRKRAEREARGIAEGKRRKALQNRTS